MNKTDKIALRPTLPTPMPGQLPQLEVMSDLEAQASEYTPSLIHDFGFGEEDVHLAQMGDPRACLDI